MNSYKFLQYKTSNDHTEKDCSDFLYNTQRHCLQGIGSKTIRIDIGMERPCVWMVNDLLYHALKYSRTKHQISETCYYLWLLLRTVSMFQKGPDEI